MKPLRLSKVKYMWVCTAVSRWSLGEAHPFHSVLASGCLLLIPNKNCYLCLCLGCSLGSRNKGGSVTRSWIIRNAGEEHFDRISLHEAWWDTWLGLGSAYSAAVHRGQTQGSMYKKQSQMLGLMATKCSESYTAEILTVKVVSSLFCPWSWWPSFVRAN